jgi:hypothetical protein
MAGTDGGRMMTDRQHHTVRRLETFSDIVIAFTLSGLAFSLRLPARSQDLVAHPCTSSLF